MTDQTPSPVQQTSAPGQQDNWEARYKGLVAKVEELTLTNRDLNAQLGIKTSEIERLTGQLGVKDTEKTIAVSERDRLLSEATSKTVAIERENAELKGLQLKIQVAKEIGHPELISIIDRIPSLTDKEAMTAVMKDFADFAGAQVKAREQQLMAGVTPGFQSVQLSPAAPASEKDWMAKINETPLGSPERARAFDAYYDWMNTQK